MQQLVASLVDFIRKVSTELPSDIVEALQSASTNETGRSKFFLESILKNVEVAKSKCVPMCQDTGTVTFWFDVHPDTDTAALTTAARDAVAEATAKGYLRQNTILEPEGRSQPDNLSATHPIIHFKTVSDSAPCRVRLLLKGGGSENMSRQYSLPDAELNAGRDLDGVRKCILDAVWRAQGNGCAPGILGVCIGGDRATGYELAKEQLLRKLGVRSEELEVENAQCTMDNAQCKKLITNLEERISKDANELGIGPMGTGGSPTLLGVHITTASRVPASYFVTVAYMCWACRRGELHF